MAAVADDYCAHCDVVAVVVVAAGAADPDARKAGTVHRNVIPANDGNNYSAMLGGAEEDHVLHGQRRPAANARYPLELLAF